MNQTPSILLIDDNEQIRRLAGDLLRQEFPDSRISEVSSLDSLRQALEAGGFDIAITDYQLGWTDGLTVLREIKRRYPDCPVVMFTGTGSEEIAVEAMKVGLDDYVLKSSSEHVARLSASVREVLARAEERRTARDTEARYRSLINDVLDTSAVGLFILDAAFKVVWINEAVERYFGLRRTDVIGQDKRRLIRDRIKQLFDQPEEVAARILQSYDRSSGELCFECHMPAADGREARWFEHRSLPIRTGPYAGGRIEHYYDITERIQAEDTVRRGERRLRNLIDGMGPSMFTGLLTPDGTVIEKNQPSLAIAGLKPEDVLGKPFDECYWWAYSEEVKRQLREAIERAARGEPSHYDVRVRVSENRFITIDFSLQPVRDETGRIVFLVPSAVDITERKRAEAELAEREEYLRLFIDHSPVALAMFDRDMRYRAVSRRWRRDYRLGDELLIGRSHYEVFPEIPQRWREVHRRCLAGATERCEEDAFVRTDGRTDWLRWEILPWYKTDGAIGGIVIFTEDITVRKQAEEAMRTSQERLALAVRATKLGPWDWDLRTNEVTLFPEWEYQVDFADQEIPVRIEEWEARLHPEDHDRVLDALRASLEGQAQDYEVEYRLRRKDGSYRWIYTRAVALRDAEGKPLHMLGCYLDITERVKATEALRESEQRFRQVTENIHEVFWMTDRDKNRMVYVSPAYEDIWGRTCASLYASPRSWLDAIHSDDRARVLESAMTRQVTGQYHETYRIIRPDDTARWIEDWAFPIRNEHGDVDRVVGVAQDITVRKEAEEDLRRANETLSAIIRSSPLAIMIVNTENRVTFWNPAAEQMFGWTEAEIIGQPLPTIPSEKQEEHRVLREQALKGRTFAGLEIVRQKKNGAPIHLSVSTASMRDADGRLTGVLVIMADITSRKQMELHAARIERMAALGQLLGGIVHELKNPLFVLAGRLELAKEKLRSQDYATLPSDLDKIEEAAKRMIHVTERFLTMAKPVQGQRTRCAIPAILQQTLEFLNNELMKHHVQVATDLPADLPVIFSDPRLLQEVFLNLMLNAMQAMVAAHEKGTLTVNVQLVTDGETRGHGDRRVAASPRLPVSASAAEGGWIEVRIQDDGPGVSPEHRAKLFEPFFSTKPVGEGTGLGLWTVRTIVMALGGTVTCESEVGRGATFIVRLPVIASPLQPAAPPIAGPAQG